MSDRLLESARERVVFYRRGQHHISTVSGAHQWSLNVDVDVGAAKLLVVVGREHYFETVKDYPIGHLNDLRRVLQNEPWRFPFKGLRFNKIQRVADQVHRVTSWVIKPEVLDSLSSRPLWVVPESALLEKLADEKPVALNRLDDTLFVAVTADGLVSSLGQENAFLQRAGVPVSSTTDDADDGIMRLAGSQAVAAQLRSVVQILTTVPLRFWAGLDTRRLRDYSWRRAGSLCAGIFIFYMALASAYLVVANHWVDYRLRVDGAAAETSMLARRDIAMFRTRVDTMQSALSEWPPLWAAWDVFLDMKANGVGFRAVNMSGVSATFYITAERATDVLDWLSRDRRIVSAEFALPVRKVRGVEQCAIVVTFDATQANELYDLEGGDADKQAASPQAIASNPPTDRSASVGND